MMHHWIPRLTNKVMSLNNNFTVSKLWLPITYWLLEEMKPHIQMAISDNSSSGTIFHSHIIQWKSATDADFYSLKNTPFCWLLNSLMFVYIWAARSLMNFICESFEVPLWACTYIWSAQSLALFYSFESIVLKFQFEFFYFSNHLYAYVLCSFHSISRTACVYLAFTYTD